MGQAKESKPITISEHELTVLVDTVNTTLLELIRIRSQLKKLLNESQADRPNLRVLPTDS
jgi:hypothetical protein